MRKSLRLVDLKKISGTKKRRTSRELDKSALYYGRLQTIKERLERTGHFPELRASGIRSVIGEPFNKARHNEAIVTFQYNDPRIVHIDTLEEITRGMCGNHSSSYIFKNIKKVASSYKRKKVRHWEWK
jgi:hypothetical protein